MNNKVLSILTFAAIALMVISFICICFKMPSSPNIVRDTTIIRDTVWKDTTIFKESVNIIPKIVEIVKRDTMKDTVLDVERKYFQERFFIGRDTADVGIVTTGINTKVDSISLLLRLKKPIITNTVEITKFVEKKNLINIGPTVTFGYDPLRKEFGCLVGVGVTLNF